MKHAIHRVRSFEIVSPYTLHVAFEDGAEQTINLEPILAGELYRSLRDVQLFNQVQIDSEAGTLVWPNGADFDPATLYDWPQYESAFRDLARSWAPVPA